MTFDDLTAQLRAIGSPETKAAVVSRAAGNLKTALSASLKAGTAPDGTPWAPRKIDGGRPYEHAAERLEVNVYGDLIRAAITGPEVYGHFGKTKTQAPRPMLPAGGMTPEVESAIESAVLSVLNEVTK